MAVRYSILLFLSVLQLNPQIKDSKKILAPRFSNYTCYRIYHNKT